ncbi:DUF1543 domain-containing protein [Chromatiaceae bacterium AAb-1]|nr:DUF1543 domain-containing protein [Chromatiaceae bacterium AAb-1]
MKLFLVYLGGSATGANIELHDVRFVVGNSIEDTYDQLRSQWFGEQKGLHIDSYMQVSAIDGFDISLQKTPSDGEQKLFFVNLGGYLPEYIAEQHAFTLCVAPSATAAKSRAKQQLLNQVQHQHKDNLLELDNCFAIAQLQGWYIHLAGGGRHQEMRPDWSGYNVIGH